MSGQRAPGADEPHTALFPLHTVLYPGGTLPLRIFEPRYVDMVRDCMRADRAFGVVPILAGSEVGSAPRFHPRGTLAVIENFDQGEDGLLHIVARGTERFTVPRHSVRDDGLLVAPVVITPDPAEPVDPAFSFLTDLMTGLFEARPELAPPQPWRLDDGTWLAYRFAELLPLDDNDRLAVLDHDHAADKLAVIAHVIESASGAGDDSATH